jgi:hypothetical protein
MEPNGELFLDHLSFIHPSIHSSFLLSFLLGGWWFILAKENWIGLLNWRCQQNTHTHTYTLWDSISLHVGAPYSISPQLRLRCTWITRRAFLKRIGGTRNYLTLRSVLSLNNNPQNSSEMKFFGNIKFTCWKSS